MWYRWQGAPFYRRVASADFSGEAGIDGMVERGADVGVVGDRPHHGHAAGIRGATPAFDQVAA
jgi:hypothetical protein